MPTRRHVHTRNIRAEVYVRDDGLWDIEAELTDTKSRDFKLATGVREAGEPIHHMRLTITIDTRLNVVDARAESLRTPYPGHCETIEPAYRQLIGLNLMKDFRRRVRERLGGIDGCTHITELTNVLPTAAVQAFAGEVVRTQDASNDQTASGTEAAAEQKPWQLDRCHALRSDGQAVAEFYPRWYRPTASHSETSETS
jgi:hypothetical protein